MKNTGRGLCGWTDGWLENFTHFAKIAGKRQLVKRVKREKKRQNQEIGTIEGEGRIAKSQNFIKLRKGETSKPSFGLCLETTFRRLISEKIAVKRYLAKR